MKMLEYLNYAALIASVTGSTLVWKTRYAFLFWIFSNPIFIYMAGTDHNPILFVCFSVMWFTAFYGLFFKKELYRDIKEK